MSAAARLGPHETGRVLDYLCSGCLSLTGRVRHYWCPGCERSIPWCNGSGGELEELCDECAVEVWRKRELYGKDPARE